MKYGLIPGVDKPVSRLVQGTVMVSAGRQDEGAALLDAVFEQGCTAFDTAHGYGNGESERCLGRWIRDRGIREEVVIISKGAHHNRDRRRVTPYDITADLHDSLARLQTDFIDIYLLHRDDPAVPVGPIVEVLNEHMNAGLIKSFGGSNWSHHRIHEANAYATSHGLAPFAMSSPQFSLAEQIEEPWENCISIGGPSQREARDYYRDHAMPLFTWSSLAGGFFSGRFSRDNLDSFDGYFDQLCVSSYCSEENFQRLDRAQTLAESRGMSLPQVALAYVLSQPINIFALVGCANGTEFAANVEALELDLSGKGLDWLEEGGDLPSSLVG